VLVVTALWPSPRRPVLGTFIRTQVRALEQAGADLELMVLDAPWRKLLYPKGAVAVRRRVARGDIDLVHAHFGYVGIVSRVQRRVPLVVTFHGSDLLGDMVDEGRLTAVGRVQAASGRWLAGRIDAAIVQSAEMARAVPDGTPTYVIPHEVDLVTMRPTDRTVARAALGLDRDRPIVLFAADPAIRTKGYPFAQEAVDRLRRTLPDAELRVVWTETQERLALHMSAADVLVFPSLQEGSPNIVKQAMACNLPIVATDVGDVRERMDGVEGCLIRSRRADEFAAALEALIRSGRRSKGRAAVEDLAGPAVAARIMEVHEQVLAAAGR
jgi:glycosyltransferase involved in cell wall biosynthesis